MHLVRNRIFDSLVIIFSNFLGTKKAILTAYNIELTDVFKEIKAGIDLRVFEWSDVKLKKKEVHVNSTHLKMKKKMF